MKHILSISCVKERFDFVFHLNVHHKNLIKPNILKWMIFLRPDAKDISGGCHYQTKTASSAVSPLFLGARGWVIGSLAEPKSMHY